MSSFIQQAETVATEVAQIAVSLTIDKAELAAGQAVSLPKVQVGTINGKPIYLEAQLSTS